MYYNKCTIEIVCTVMYARTVNRERFTGLNFHGFHPMKFFTGNFCCALHLKYLNNAIIWNLVYIRGKTFAVLLKTAKNKSLAQRIFSHLWYMLNCRYIYMHMCSVCTLAYVILKAQLSISPLESVTFLADTGYWNIN